jgi:hypothetical protein
MQTVMNPPFVVGLGKVLAKRAGHGCTRCGKAQQCEWDGNALIESSLRLARPVSRTSTDTVGSSDKRVATTRLAVYTRELAQRVETEVH